VKLSLDRAFIGGDLGFSYVWRLYLQDGLNRFLIADGGIETRMNRKKDEIEKLVSG